MKAYTAASSRSTSNWRGRFHSWARRWLNARTRRSSPHTSMPSAAESNVARSSDNSVSSSRSVVSWRLRSSMVSSSSVLPPSPHGTRRTQRCTGTRLPSARSKLVWAVTPCAITSTGSDQNASSWGVLAKSSTDRPRMAAADNPVRRSAHALACRMCWLASSSSHTASCRPSSHPSDWRSFTPQPRQGRD